MNVRVIAGKYGGRVLDAPGRSSTHAMSERIRNAIFNSLGSRVEGARVLDAFAGSGSVGIEALSRGAKTCVFVEQDRIAAKIIRDNLALVGAQSEAQVIGKMVGRWIGSAEKRAFDVIFADPPYHDTQLTTVIRLFDLLADDGRVIISLPSEQELPAYEDIEIMSERIYGNAKIIVAAIRPLK